MESLRRVEKRQGRRNNKEEEDDEEEDEEEEDQFCSYCVSPCDRTMPRGRGSKREDPSHMD